MDRYDASPDAGDDSACDCHGAVLLAFAAGATPGPDNGGAA